MDNSYPLIQQSEKDGILVQACAIFPGKYEDEKGAYIQADNAVPILEIDVLNFKRQEALDILMELAGNYMCKSAFNALNRLGKMADVTDENTRSGFADYLFQAWKKTDAEKLEMIAFWSFPSFSYVEYDRAGKVLTKITDEQEFVNHLIQEMVSAHNCQKRIQMRKRLEKGHFLVDVMVDGKISIFSFIFGDKHFYGIERQYI